MALVSATQYGAQYQWGVHDTDAPTISGLKVRQVDLKYAPEVITPATDGEGHVDSVTMSLPAKRIITATFTGYVDSSFDPTTFPNTFSTGGRFFLVSQDGVSLPKRKGEYWEVSVGAMSWPNVNS